MDINKILNADYLDILFEGRNKKYGAYELRKKYKKRAYLGAILTILVVGGLFAATLIKPKEEPLVDMAPVVSEIKLAEPPPVDPEKPPPPPPPAAPPPVKPTVKFTPPVIEKDEDVLEEDKPEIPEPEENKVVGRVSMEGSDDPNAIDPNLSIAGDGTEAVKPAAPPAEKIFRNVEQMAEYPGGMGALTEYFSRNIRYPREAKEAGIEGRVILEFVVDEQGRISNVKIIKDIGGGCGAEAVRVAQTMPRWKPARQNGHPVKMYYSIPVSFKLQ